MKFDKLIICGLPKAFAMGRKVGVSTPLNDKVVELVHAFEQGLKEPGFHNVTEFKI